MTEQIYINGYLMDQNEGKSISLVFQSPYFTDIDNIVSNRTSSAELPKTANNLAAIDFSHLASTETLFEYNKHKVIYKRDGVQLFSGSATLLSVTPTSLKFSFVLGNVSVFKALLDTKLRDLQTVDDYVIYGMDGVNASANKDYFPDEWKAYGKWGNNGWAKSIQPIMPVAKIMERIKSKFGVAINFSSGKQLFANYYIPLTYRKADDNGRMAQGVKFSGGGIKSQLSQSISGYGLYYTRLTSVTNGDYYNDNGIIDTSGFGQIKVKFCKGFRISKPRTTSMSCGFWIGTVNDNGGYYQRIKSPKYARGADASGNYIYTIEEDCIVTLDKQYSNIVIAISDCGGEAKAPTILTTSEIYVYDGALEELEFGKGSLYPLYTNLPDWTVSQLIKNLMKLEGVFAYSNDDKTINFVTISDLYTNRKIAFDWSNNLMDIDNGPTERSISFNNFAKKNWCKYAEDDNVAPNYDGYIRSNGVDIEDENELITLDFAPTRNNANNVDVIECWLAENQEEVEWNEVTPRILHSRYSKDEEKHILTFAGLDWRTIINNRYSHYQNAVEYPRTIKASVRLSLYDLLRLDMTVPVYAKQWGHYYAITKLTTKDNGVADVELLQLGKATIYSILGGTGGEGEDTEQFELVAVPLGDGGYYIDLKGQSLETTESLIASNEYHLALIRYGYTRRGRPGKKTDRKYGSIGTHTAYNVLYKKRRGGMRFRIIGHDILKHITRIDPNSTTPINDYLTGTTKQLDTYANSTLVFEFGDRVVLPPMKTHKKIVTRDGRISNTSARGMGELYVGLIKPYKEGDVDTFNLRSYGWTCVSNLLQVRGLHSDRLGWWEFEESNIKGVEDV